jgi:tRNA1Val (adenine37-N6)-methyltransferase
MPNSYFRFKQFTIQQDLSAMKVCTDSCILGAWTSSRLEQSASILDIGTGTGLLAMMLAQQSDARIDAIETEPDAATQARENIINGPWSDRIRILEGDARFFSFENAYDFIISNPPFYESDLRSARLKKNMAMHGESLSLPELLHIIRSNLRPEGAFSILLPYHRTGYFKSVAAQNGFFIKEKLTIRQTSIHAPFRSILLLTNKKTDPIISDKLMIKNETGEYSEVFSTLMQDYYL